VHLVGLIIIIQIINYKHRYLKTVRCNNVLIKQKFLVFERRLFRRIFGPTQKTNGEWRQRTNEELENLINHENIVRHIKSKRLSWVGHVERMPDERVVKSIYKWKPHARRPKGRPRLRWDDDVRDDLRKMGSK